MHSMCLPRLQLPAAKEIRCTREKATEIHRERGHSGYVALSSSTYPCKLLLSCPRTCHLRARACPSTRAPFATGRIATLA